jgi:hypothetical protein
MSAPFTHALLAPSSAHRWIAWSSESGHILGTVIRDKIGNDWSAVLVGADQHGEYRAFDMAHSMPDVAAARHWLHQAMAKVIRLGQAVFPQ